MSWRGSHQPYVTIKVALCDLIQSFGRSVGFCAATVRAVAAPNWCGVRARPPPSPRCTPRTPPRGVLRCAANGRTTPTLVAHSWHPEFLTACQVLPLALASSAQGPPRLATSEVGMGVAGAMIAGLLGFKEISPKEGLDEDTERFRSLIFSQGLIREGAGLSN